MSEDRPDEADEFDLSDELADEWIAEWDQADRDAVKVLSDALAQYRGQSPPGDQLTGAAGRVRSRLREGGRPLDWVQQAAGMSRESIPEDDAELLIQLAAATMSPQEETGLEVEEESALLTLEHADWLGAIVSAVRDGPGADASPDGLVDGIRRCPEVDSEADMDPDDESFVETAFWIIALPWEALGLIDRDQRLTTVGQWVLPRALARAWGGDFDGESGSDDT